MFLSYHAPGESPESFLWRGAPQKPAPEWSRLMLAYNEQGRIALEPDGYRFPSRQLVPQGTLPQNRRYTTIVESLYFQEQQIGFVLFEMGLQEKSVYYELRGYISSALQGNLLMAHVEERVEERTAELKREIVKRQQIEYSLRVSEQQYRLLAESVGDGIVIVQDGLLVFTNAVFAGIIGCSPGDLLRVEAMSLFSKNTRQTVHDWLARGEEEPLNLQWQAELITRDECIRWIEVSQTSIVWEGKPAILLTVRDIHDRKFRETRLEEERTRLRQENITLKSTITERYKFGPIVGKSPAMQRVYELILSAAVSDVNVLICGESGTGKELIAHRIHQVSRRKKQAFVPVNCASIPETLFEREFFGHRKGSFTGADRDRPGLFDQAHRGTLFLDEVTELSPGTQAKLLRVLQDGQYFQIGSAVPKQADVLVIAATNKEWKTLIEQELLRKDFFYRICVIEIRVPPLRERKEDLPLLIEHLLDQYRRKQERVQGSPLQDFPTELIMLPAELVQALYMYQWSGNVRELDNVLQRYLATDDLASVISLISGSRQAYSVPDVPKSAEISLPEAVKAFEKQMIADMLARMHYHKTKSARMLGIPRRTLHHKIKQSCPS
ncbi:MAG: PAS domain S-box protein [bacterium]|nr:PAS domain S-box protein [bacterium]